MASFLASRTPRLQHICLQFLSDLFNNNVKYKKRILFGFVWEEAL